MDNKRFDIETGMNAALFVGHGLAAAINPDHSLIDSVQELLSSGSEIVESTASITENAVSVVDTATAAADLIGMIVT